MFVVITDGCLIPLCEQQVCLQAILTATLHHKTTAEYEPNFFWKLASPNEWIVYPWERKDSKTIQDYKTC